MHHSNTACFLDLDHTIFDTDQFFHLDVRQSFLRLGIDAAEWEQSYAAVWPTGYTLEKHAQELSRRSGSRLPLEEMRGVLQNSFADLRRYLFPDVLPFLQAAKRNGVRLYLLSFGDPEWQRYKVSACALDACFDELFFTATAGGKCGLVLEKVKGFTGTVLVIDNNSADLDSIRYLDPRIRTYLMNRVPEDLRSPTDDLSRRRYFEARGYLDRVPRHRHIPCRSLDAILQDLQP